MQRLCRLAAPPCAATWRRSRLAARLAEVLRRPSASVATGPSIAPAGSPLGQVMEICAKRRHYFIHLGNALFFCAITQTDMLNLRAMSIVASSFGVLYNLLQPTPLIAPAGWGLFFISCHLYYVLELLRERQKIVLTPEKEKVYEVAFFRFGFTPRQFCDLLEAASARWCTFTSGAVIHKAGDPVKDISFLVDGEVHMYSRSGDFVKGFAPGKGGWLGQFYDPNITTEEQWDKEPAGCDPTALVHASTCEEDFHCMTWRCASTECRTLVLSRRELHAHLSANPRLKEAACRSQVDDLWGKLNRSVPESRRAAYRQMLEVATSDGSVDSRERSILDAWRERHHISNEDHATFLAEIGWSAADFQAGRRARRLI